MEHFPRCDERQVAAITRGIANAALGQMVSYWVDSGMTKRTENGTTVDIPNGTLSIHIYINGGAVDQTVGERTEPTP